MRIENQLFTTNQSRGYKNELIDNIIRAWIIIGFIGIGMGFFHDNHLGPFYFTPYTILTIHIALLCFVMVLYFYRNSLNHYIKSSFLIFIFIMETILLFVGYGAGLSAFIMLCMSVFQVSITFSVKTSLVVIVAFSLIIPIMGVFFISGTIVTPVDLNELQRTPIHWIYAYFIFTMFASTVLVGVTLYNRIVENKISELDENGRYLEQAILKMNKHAKEKEKYETELEEKEFKWRGIINASTDAMLLLDETAQVLEVNQAATTLTGYDKAEMNKLGLFNLISNNYRLRVKAGFETLLQGGLSPNTDFSIISKEGKTIHVEQSSNLIISEQKIMIVAFIRDISFRKRHEHEKLNAVISAEEKERARLSKDLHDDLGPSFSGIKLFLQALRRNEQDEAKKESLDHIIGMVDNSVKQIRDISHNLSPYLLRDKGLVEAISYHLQLVESSNSLKTNFYVDENIGNVLSANKETLIYRSFLELFNNTIKHARATEVVIDLTTNGEIFTMCYQDNGVGFKNRKIEPGSVGIGLKNIISRVEASKGSVKFEHTSDHTKVNVMIPV